MRQRLMCLTSLTWTIIKKRKQNGTCFTWSLGRLVGRWRPGLENRQGRYWKLGYWEQVIVASPYQAKRVSALSSKCSFYCARGIRKPKMDKKKKVIGIGLARKKANIYHFQWGSLGDDRLILNDEMEQLYTWRKYR